MMRIHLSVGQRVTLGFLVMILLVALASGVGVSTSNSARTALDNAHNNSTQIEQIRSLQLRWASVVTLVDNLLLSRQSSLIIEQLNQEIDDFNGQLAALQEQTIGQDPAMIAENKDILNDLQQLGSDLTVVIGQIVEYTQAGSWARAQTLRFTEMTSLQRRLAENLDQLNLNLSKDIDAEVASSNNQQNSARRQLISIIVFALVMSSILAFFTTRSITIPVAQLLANVKRIMNRDFSHQEVLKRKDEFGTLSQATSLMTDLLKETYEQLEQRVADRTKALATSSEVSRRLSSILDKGKLAVEVVEQLKAAFHYYHAHIYLLNASGETLIMTGGTGEAGQKLLEQGHSIPRGRGLVGRAAETKEVVLAPDTRSDPNWLPNPLLPETQSEAAIPILAAGQVLGVLDVQNNVAGSLTEEDVNLLRSIADQTAIALQNISATEETQKLARDYKELVENSPAAIAVLDAETGVFTEANQKALELYDIARDDMNKIGPIQLSPALQPDGQESAVKAQALISQAMEKGGMVFEWIHQTRNGREFLAEIRLVRVAGAGGRPLLNALMTDITEQRRMEETNRKRATQQESLNRITQKIQSATSIEAALKVAVRELGHAVGMKPTRITLDQSTLAAKTTAPLDGRE